MYLNVPERLGVPLVHAKLARPTHSCTCAWATQPADWEAPAKQGRTTGRELSSGVAAVPIVPGASPALERATILSSVIYSPPESLGLVPRARRVTVVRVRSKRLEEGWGKRVAGRCHLRSGVTKEAERAIILSPAPLSRRHSTDRSCMRVMQTVGTLFPSTGSFRCAAAILRVSK